MIFLPRWHHLYSVERKRIPTTPEGDMRLHRLERPVAWPERVWPVVDHIERYPSYPPFIHRLSKFLGYPESQIVLGAGIEDFIRTLILLCCDEHNAYAYSWPTCAMFELYAKIMNTAGFRVVTEPYDTSEAWFHKVVAFADLCRLIILPNPGQPVEKYLDNNNLRVLASACQANNCVLAIDEAYYGFGAPTALPLVNEFDNIIILRTFSKAFGAAGIRVGYAVGQERVVKPLDAFRLSGEITGPSLRAATRLLAHWADEVQPGIAEIREGRNWLRDKFGKAGYEARGSLANHVLVKLGDASRARSICAMLKDRGIHVKGDYPSPLDGYVLITAGPVSMMQKFWEVFIDCSAEEITLGGSSGTNPAHSSAHRL